MWNSRAYKNSITLLAAIPVIVLVFTLFLPTSANSAEPPALVIILNNAPPDSTASIVTSAGETVGALRQVAWEKYYVFYSSEIGVGDYITVRLDGGEESESYEIEIDKSTFPRYNGVVTVDFAKRTATPGKLIIRSILLISLRVVLTLVIEGLIFLLFGFRQPRSIVCFLIINLVTQTALNIALNGLDVISAYPLFALIFYELIIFIVEAIAFPVTVKEHGVIRRIAFALTANLASLVLGGFLITMLPV